MSDEPREALARWLSAAIDRESTWDRSGEDYRDRYRIDADQILAGPLLDLVIAAVERDRLRERLTARSPVRQAATVLSDEELSDALDLWCRQREETS